MEEFNNFLQEPDEILYQAWERFKELLMKCPQHYLPEMQETATDAKTDIQEMAAYSQKWHNGTYRTKSTETSDGLATIQAQLNNLGREIKKVNEKVYAAQGRIDAIDADEEIILVNDEVNVTKEVVGVINTAKLIIDAAQVSSAGDIVSTASVATTVSAATITTAITVDDITLAQALA
ncbi:hypothetical protein Tco_0000451 [Tanacetum coccineum]